MNFRDRVLCEEGFSSTPDGFQVTIRLPRYRSLPLSCIRPDTLKVDGEEIPPGSIRFHVNGQSHALDELAQLFDEWWFVTDPAELLVERQGGLPAGEHDVEVQLKLRIPYVFIEGGKDVLTEVAGARKRLTLAANGGAGGESR